MAIFEYEPVPGITSGQDITSMVRREVHMLRPNPDRTPKIGPDGARHGDAVVVGNNIFRWNGVDEQYVYEELKGENLVTSGERRLCSGEVCSREDRAREHIDKHNLPLQNPFEYLHVADMALKEGTPAGRNETPTQETSRIRIVTREGRRYRVVFNGLFSIEGKQYRVVRSVTQKGREKPDPYPGYNVRVKTIGNKPRKQYTKPRLPEWTSQTVDEAIRKLGQNGKTKGTFSFEYPEPHLVKVQVKAGTVRAGYNIYP